MRKLSFIPVFMLLFLSLAGSKTFGWGPMTHSCIGGNATDWEYSSVFLNANNGPDICHSMLRDVSFAHDEIGFADKMAEVGNSVSPPWISKKMLDLAYGWGGHIKADDIAHGEMLVGFDEIEHNLSEIAIDWWLWNEGSDEEKECARNTTVMWSSWLVYETSRQYEEGVIIWPAEFDRGGDRLASLIAAEAILMISPGFYERAASYSDNTKNLLEDPEVWQEYYRSAIDNVKSWLFDQAAVLANTSGGMKQAKPGFQYDVLIEIGERAIELGGILKVVHSDEYFNQITLNVKDQSLCERALKDIVSKRLKTASDIERNFLLTLSGECQESKKSATGWGDMKGPN